MACCFGLYDVELEAWVIAGRLNVSVYMAVKAFDQNFIVGANGIDASRHNGLHLSVYQDPVAVRQGSCNRQRRLWRSGAVLPLEFLWEAGSETKPGMIAEF